MTLRGFIKRWLALKPSDASLATRMREDWDARARENARHYVATLNGEWNDTDFFQSGNEWIRFHILPDLPLICGDRSASEMRVVEIGSGAGRMTRGLSEIFGSVDGVDISAEMISKARAALTDRPNVRLHLNSGMDLSMFETATVDFVFSAIVFQHIPSKSIVCRYISEAHRILRRGCVFKFQVQGCPIRQEDVNTWVGVGFSEREIKKVARQMGFQIHAMTGSNTQEYWLTLIKKQ